jgi:hypothetical protein
MSGIAGFWLCTIVTVGWSVGGECVRGRCSVVTGWGRIRRGELKRGERVDEKGQKE